MKLAIALTSLLVLGAAGAALADTTPQSLPFSQDWTNTGLITANDDWSGVPGIIGYRGDNGTPSTGVDPTTILIDLSGTPVDVNANQTTPNSFTTGGITEFEIGNPVVALAGSGTADVPGIVIAISTLGKQNIQVSCRLIDLEDGADNAVQSIALQYRVGNSGDFANVTGGYVADATQGPSIGGLVTPMFVTLPGAADNQAEVQVRFITTNAVGNDEWVGIDDIRITGDSLPVPAETTTWGAVKSGAGLSGE